jgi:type I restriction enzyme S subunit
MTTNHKPLPPGWAWTALGEIAAINPRGDTRELPTDLQVAFVPMSAVDALSGSIVELQSRTVGELRKGFTPFAAEDVLFAKITPSMENGKAAIARQLLNGRGFGSTEFHVMRPSSGVIPEWIFHFIRQERFRADAKAHFAGTAGQLRVPSDFLKDYPFPLPPLAEQRRIVARLEELLTRLDAGVRALKQVQAKLKRYRAAVLKAACEGRLLGRGDRAPTDRAPTGDEPAEKLLARILAERRAKWEADLRATGRDPSKVRYAEPQPPNTANLPALPEAWCWATVEQIAENIQYGHTESANEKPVGPKFLRITDIQNGKVDWPSVPYCVCSEEEHNKYRLQAGDIVFARTGATTGKSFLMLSCPDAVFASYLIRLRLFGTIDTQYFACFLESPHYWAQIMDVKQGSAQPGVNASILATLVVPIPPLAEQRRIVAEVERRLSVVEEMEQAVAANLARAGRLRQAVLRRAFEGRLVPQDPSDEPAEKLLERIRAAREGAHNAPRPTAPPFGTGAVTAPPPPPTAPQRRGMRRKAQR